MTTISQLIEHLNSLHNAEILFFQQFEQWKLQEESKMKTHYVRNTSAKVYGMSKHYHFYCNRSGCYKSKGHTKRQLKLGGSNKIGTTCVSYIQEKQDLKTDKTIAEYCEVHNSHDIKLCHLPVPNDIKLSIATKLENGVSEDRILDDVRVVNTLLQSRT